MQTWLAAGGGAMLWDELAADLGFKPLVAGHTGPSPGVWAAARLETVADLAGARVHADGLAADVLRALGAAPTVRAGADSDGEQLADGRLQAAEWLGPLAAVAPDLQPLAQRLYQPGFNRNGMVLSLNVAKPLWDGMSAADRAIFEGCAAQEYQLSLADAAAHALIERQVESPSKWPVRLGWSSELAAPSSEPRPRPWPQSPTSIRPRAASTTATRPSAACCSSLRRPEQQIRSTRGNRPSGAAPRRSPWLPPPPR